MLAKERIINQIIEGEGFKSYLEIGIAGASCFDRIGCEKRQGVEPSEEMLADLQERGYGDMELIFQGTSDEFFAQKDQKKKEKERFDLIFIDGLHHADQVEKDIVNAWYALNEGGVILLHDVHPPTEAHQVVPREQLSWTGDVWKSFVGFRQKYPKIPTGCFREKYGLGWIKKVPRTKVEPGFALEEDWSYFLGNFDNGKLLGYDQNFKSE